jgi:4-diphosphocytidyl-2-C-methyl-D-erythritol kinase
LIAFTDYGDELTVEAASDLSLAIDGPFAAGFRQRRTICAPRRASADGRGAVTRGARLRLTAAGGVGIGGGSADAVAAMKALTQLWGLLCLPAGWGWR